MLSDEVYVVVGGANGIGKATARTLADLGASVVVSDLGTDVYGEGESPDVAESAAAEIRESGGDAMAHFGDVSDFEDAASLVEDTVEEYGRIDGAINFAGVLRDSILYRMDEDDWDTVTDVHLKGHFCLLRHLSAHWHERASADGLDGDRAFLGVSSRSGLGNIGQANYAAAKAGVLGLVRTAARELYRDGVRVNALMPTAYTRMIAAIPEDKQPFTREEMPPERVATVVAYLLSGAAEGVTGCTFWAGNDGIGLVNDPDQVRTAYRDGGWTVQALAEAVPETLGDGDDSLTRVGRAF